MNCHYHPDREVIGMCVNCGKPICAECKVELSDDKLYCNKCILDWLPSFREKSSWFWWLLPTFLGIAGGVLAYALSYKNSPIEIKNKNYLIVGLFTNIAIVLWVLLILISF